MTGPRVTPRARTGNGGTAGNPSPTANAVNYPAAYPGVISVGSFNQAVIKSPFSVRQRYVTLTAAGQGVIAAAMPHGYAVMNSTSAASAIVAGISALIKSQFPELTPAQVAQALKSGTVFRPAGKTGDGSGAGTADAARALAAAATIAGPGAQRAGAGAQPHVLPAAPPLPTFRQSLTSARLEKDGIISAAVLVLLLLLVAVFWMLRRRRDGMSAFGEPEWHERERYPETGDSSGEPELAYLAAPADRAAAAASPGSGSHQPGGAGPEAAGPGSGPGAAGAGAGRAGLGAARSTGGAGSSAFSPRGAGLRGTDSGRSSGSADSVWGSATGRQAARGRARGGGRPGRRGAARGV